MSRVIKFRFWNRLDEYMYYNSTDIEFCCGHMTGVFLDGEFVGIDNLEVMQYTGLKDRNGKEIYEGDILKCGENFLWNVEFFEDGYVAIGAEFPGMYNLHDVCDRVEIVGNKYEKPELLER